MTDLSSGVTLTLFLFLIAPFAFGWIAIRLKLPSLVGYIVSGVFLSIFAESRLGEVSLSQFATVGIILLLFTVGLELDLSQFTRYGKFIMTAGLLQVGVSVIFIFFFSLLFQFGFIPSLIISTACALSSTAIVAKLIQERGEEHSLLGSMIIGILLFQDIMAMPLLIIFASLSKQASVWNASFTLIISLIKSIFVFGFMYMIGKRVVPLMFGKLAQTSRELLNLLTLIFILSTVMIFSFMRLPTTVAAFLSGALVAQTMEHYHIFSQIRPLRDVFAILFFVFLGAQVNLSVVITQFPIIVVFLMVLIIVKFAVVLVLFIIMRFHSRTAFSAGILLFQSGEFAFIILHQGVVTALISDNAYMIILSVVLISIALTPSIVSHKDSIYFALKKIIKERFPSLYVFLESRDREPAHLHVVEYSHHVVICGYGRLGSYIGRALHLANIPFVAIDYNIHTVARAKKKDIVIIYGDPTDIDVLDYANTEKAKILITALPDKFSQETIILHARRLNRGITIFARVHQERYKQRMRDLGAHSIIQPEFEAAVSIVKKILLNFNIPRENIVGKIKRLKLEHGME